MSFSGFAGASNHDGTSQLWRTNQTWGPIGGAPYVGHRAPLSGSIFDDLTLTPSSLADSDSPIPGVMGRFAVVAGVTGVLAFVIFKIARRRK